MSVSVSEFEPFLTLFAPDAPPDVLQHVIREAAIRFMRRTRVAEDYYTIETQCGVRDYWMDLPDCRELIAINGIEPNEGAWPFFPGAGWQPNAWDWVKDGRHPVIQFGFTPQEDKCYTVSYSWSIGRDECDIPDFIFEEWEEAVKHGALSELLMMPNQEWTRPKMAQYHAEMYRREVVSAKSRRWHNYTEGALQLHAPPFMDPPHRRRR